MSNPGQIISDLLKINASASQIETKWLREAVLAISVLARPIGLLAIGIALAYVLVRIAQYINSPEMAVWAVVVISGVFTGAAAFGSWDKRTAVKAGGQP